MSATGRRYRCERTDGVLRLVYVRASTKREALILARMLGGGRVSDWDVARVGG